MTGGLRQVKTKKRTLSPGGPTMPDYPRSIIAFQRRFPDEAAGAAYLADLRWPDGFCCPACGHGAALDAEDQALDLRVPRLPAPDLGQGRQPDARLEAGAQPCGSGRPISWPPIPTASRPNGISAQRHLGLAAAKAARPRLLQDGLAIVRQAPGRHGRSAAQPLGRPTGDRRNHDPLPPSPSGLGRAASGAAPKANC